MAQYKFIHAADLHLDSPLRGLDTYDGAPADEIRSATRQALENLVSLAIEEEVAFVLLAGDIYDGSWNDYNTGLYFVSQLAELNDVGIKVYLVSGNHDADSKITKKLPLPKNVTQFPSSKPKTIIDDILEYAVHGQSFGTSAVKENLAGNYPAPIKNHLNIGLLHTSVDGREGHANYAPCTLRDLTDKGYDYWALGHIHKREILSEDPYVIFPGNIQGRHARETGPKGCTLVTVEDTSITDTTHHNLDVLRWFTCDIDASQSDSLSDLHNSVSDSLKNIAEENSNMILAIRINISGDTNLHYKLTKDKDEFINDCRAQAMGISGANIWIEKVRFKTTALELKESNETNRNSLANIHSRVENMLNNDELIESITKDFSEFIRRLPPESIQIDDEIMLTDKSVIKELIKDAGDLIIGHLSEDGSY